MDQIIIERYITMVPSVIVNATKPLGDEKCWAVFIALLKEDGLRFNQIKELYHAKPAEISRILKSLANAGLIAKKTRIIDDIGNTESSYYTPTTLGKSIIRSLYRGLLPPGVTVNVPELTDERAGPSSSPNREYRTDVGQPVSISRLMPLPIGAVQYHNISSSKRETGYHVEIK
jgi:DNA-binding MarR family transcriptional regulator